jgi:hypothetical protein
VFQFWKTGTVEQPAIAPHSLSACRPLLPDRSRCALSAAPHQALDLRDIGQTAIHTSTYQSLCVRQKPSKPFSQSLILSTQKMTGEEPLEHIYASLVGPENIRLLVLEPATDLNAPLHFSFREGSLEELEGQYEAISYTWGEPDLTYPLQLLDNSCIWITKNLDLALRRFRRPDRTRSLWADAACINQQDDQEKAIQIPLMTCIFSGARKVQVWLGPGGEEERGLHILDRWSRRSPQTEIALTTEDIRSITKLFSLPWFGRLWIIQELVSNQEPILIYGLTELSWFRVWKAFKALRKYADDHDCIPTMVSALKTGPMMADLWDESFGLGSSDDTLMGILDLLDVFSSHTCTDARDRIFALYSMADNVSSKEDSVSSIVMAIDYSMNVQQTYEHLAVACAKQYEHGFNVRAGQNILGAALKRQWYRCPHDWLTWIPDWRIAPRRVQEPPRPIYEQVLPDNSVIIRLRCGWPSSQVFQPHPVQYGPPYVIRGVECESEHRLPIKGTYNRLPPFVRSLYPIVDGISNLQSCSGSFTLEAYQQTCHKLQVPSDCSCLADGLAELHTQLKYLAKGRLLPLEENPASECKKRASQTEPIACALQVALEDYCLFTASAPIGPTKVFGIGNKHMQSNDVLVSYFVYWYHCANSRRGKHTHQVHRTLILRPVVPVGDEALHVPCESFRLVGSACVFSPVVRECPSQIEVTVLDRFPSFGEFHGRLC